MQVFIIRNVLSLSWSCPITSCSWNQLRARDIFYKTHSSSSGCWRVSDKGERGERVSVEAETHAKMNMENMKTKLRRSFSKIQRPRIAITRASMESQDFASTGELDVVRALKVRQTFLTNLQYDLWTSCVEARLYSSLRQSCNCKSLRRWRM